MKKSFSMIELILAIVIMGISLLAVPIIITQSSSANAYALQQEAVLASKMQLGLTFFTPWDSSDDEGKVVQTDSDTPGLQNLKIINATGIEENNPNARKNLPESKVAYSDKSASIPKYSPELKGLDQYFDKNVTTIAKLESTERGNRDMIFDLNSIFKVSYIDDKLLKGGYFTDKRIEFEFNPNEIKGKTSNIKQIELYTDIKDVGDDKCDIVLRAFSSNIARPKLIIRKIKR